MFGSDDHLLHGRALRANINEGAPMKRNATYIVVLTACTALYACGCSNAADEKLTPENAERMMREIR